MSASEGVGQVVSGRIGMCQALAEVELCAENVWKWTSHSKTPPSDNGMGQTSFIASNCRKNASPTVARRCDKSPAVAFFSSDNNCDKPALEIPPMCSRRCRPSSARARLGGALRGARRAHGTRAVCNPELRHCLSFGCNAPRKHESATCATNHSGAIGNPSGNRSHRLSNRNRKVARQRNVSQAI